jgi:hypothetical protein
MELLADGPTRASTVDLYWIPLGAGNPVVQTSGRLFESLAAWRQHRPRRDLYHAALVLDSADGRLVVEQAPVPDDDGSARGVVASGPVGLRLAGRLRIFRYEIRCWPGGTIPDIGFAVESPASLSSDPEDAARIVATLPEVPTFVWGRDEAGTGDMWNSNSVVSWVLTRSGLDLDHVEPPSGGRAPGWSAGRTIAERGRDPHRPVVGSSEAVPIG